MVNFAWLFLVSAMDLPFAYAQKCVAPEQPNTMLVDKNTVVVADCKAQDTKFSGEFCIEITGKNGGGIFRMNREGKVLGSVRQPSYMGVSQLSKEASAGKAAYYAERIEPKEILDPTVELMNFFHPVGSGRDHLVDRPKSRYENWIGSLRAAITAVRKEYGCKIPVLPPARPGDAQKNIRPLPHPAGSTAN